MTEREGPARPAQAGVPDEPYYRQPIARRRANRPALGTALIIVGLIWLLSSAVPSLWLPRIGGHGTAVVLDTTQPASRLSIDAGEASVEVTRWSGEGIRVQAIRRGGSDKDFTVTARRDGDTLLVSQQESPCFLICDRSLEYRIQMPAGVPAVVSTVSGDVRVSAIDGGVDVRTTSGDVQLSEIRGPVSVTTINGDIELADSQAAGAVVRTTSGSVHLDGVTQKVDVESVSGDVEVQDAADSQLKISTTSGDIDYTGSLAPSGESSISSISGDVELRLPERGGVTLSASTISGDISTDLDLRGAERSQRSLRGSVGDGGASLSVSTTSGSVSIDRQ